MKLNSIFLLSAFASVAILASCNKESLQPTSSEGFDAKKPGSVSVRNPLFIPATASPNNYVLSATPGISNIGGNKTTKAWMYNGSLPGPTLIANSGDNVSIQFKNNLPEPSITHWHGMIVDHQNDGQPMQAIPSGATYQYNYPIVQRAALNWYHPHPHMLTGKQVYNGLAGAFIVRDAEEAALNLPSGNYEVPLVVRDATMDNTANLVYKPTGGGFLGKFPMVNGTVDPYLTVERAVYRFRLLNGSNSRIYNFAMSNPNVKFQLIGNDGGLLPTATTLSQLYMANGERLDILIDFRNLTAGTNVMLKDLKAGWDILEFRVTGNNVVAFAGLPAVLSTVAPLGAPVKTRNFSFDGMSKINGKVYNMNAIEWTVPFNTVEKWVLTTNGNAPHPVHIHGASFQVVSRSGGRGQVYPWEAGWKDTVLLEDGETVTILIRFDKYAGKYVMHCHKLEHEDMGMMANFEVVQ